MTNNKRFYIFLLEKVSSKDDSLHKEKVPAQRKLDDITSSMMAMAYNPSHVFWLFGLELAWTHLLSCSFVSNVSINCFKCFKTLAVKCFQ